MAHFLPPKISSSLQQQQQQQQQQHLTPPEAPRTARQQPRASERPATPAVKDRERPRDRVRSHHTSSLSGWVRNILPSHRSERGGTRRNQGYWEQVDDTETAGRSPRRRAADSHQSAGGESVSSNRITRWNVPRDLSEGPAACSASAPPSRGQQQRAAWPWSRDHASESPLSMAKLGGILQGGAKTALPDHVSDAGTGGRRSSEAHRAVHKSLESRRLRQVLKKSGDYLGVQGINPRTGEFDVMTPTDSTPRSSFSADSDGKVKPLWKLLQAHDRTATAVERPGAEGEEEKAMEEEKFDRLQRQKEMIKTIGKSVRWRRRKKEWSSAQEPGLSPITQSLRSTSPVSRRQSRMKRFQDDDSLLDKLIKRKASKTGLHHPPPQSQSGVPVVQDPAADAVTPSSNSSGTIIKTPHRRRSTHATPAAWELFDNGIEFGASGGMADAPREAADVAALPEEQPSQNAQSSGNQELPVECEVQKSDDSDFLGVRASSDIDPGDTREDTTLRFTLMPCNKTEDPLASAMEGIAAAALEAGGRGIDEVARQSAAETAGGTFSLLGRSPLRSTAPRAMHLRRQRSDGDGLRKRASKTKAAPLLHRHSVLTMRSRAMETAWRLTAADVGPRDLFKCGTKNKTARILDGTKPVDKALQVEREATDEAMGRCVSIPTTTTTGCDRKVSPSSLGEGTSEELKLRQVPQSHEPSRQETCERPTPSSCGISAEASPRPPPLSAVPSTRSPGEDAAAVGTLSTGTGRQDVQVLLPEWMRGERPRSTSLTSTSSPSRGLARRSTWDRQLEAGVRDLLKHPLVCVPPPETIPSRSRIRKLPAQTSRGRHEGQGRPAGEPRFVRCPGGFPTELEDEGGGGDTDGPLGEVVRRSWDGLASWREAAVVHAAVQLASSLLCLCWVMARSLVVGG